jgi:tRNA uridine 5-carboxymethylaminomethyl modification enzyme
VLTPTHALEQHVRQLGLTPLAQRVTAEELLRRPEVRYGQVAALVALGCASALPDLDEDAATQVELGVKYAGYIRRQTQSVRQVSRLESSQLPEDLNYGALSGLRVEARHMLARVRPRSIGQAARVPGVTPADVAVLLVWLQRWRAERAEATVGA